MARCADVRASSGPTALVGRRSAPSLPIGLRVGDEDESLRFRLLDEAGADRIKEDVVGFVAIALFAPESMLEEVALPLDG